ncbi:FtsX-like permease family protein [Variovorax sp. J22P168]|uniref:FtsX-like permease family protein n=1 Tax=Variovorax jilinensis TaxID=3053513 RepID=UPI002577E72F|nr:ABC transporter permease [Variovorax sp. J22P168]MDM0012973.1 FtsX-like permease family protein [Variovorax sp. J22P168]
MKALLLTFSWQELRHHPWRNAAAVVAVMLGVALAFSVQLINASALDEFSSAVRSVNGQPDLELRAAQGAFDEALYEQVARQPQVLLASPVLELQSALQAGERRLPLRVIGVDALVLPGIAPALMPRPAEGAGRFALFAPGRLFLNAAARQALSSEPGPLRLRAGNGWQPVLVAGEVAAGGTPLAVMDIGAAQDLFDRGGRLTRIDLRLAPGSDPAAFRRSLQALPGWPDGIQIAEPGDAAERVSNLSRAYRVNLTVLALVALFTGAFLVFSVLALSVAKRAQQFALLGVLGLTPRERLRLVLAESLALGVIGSAAGIALGAALAELALRLLGGDLGGGYFDGVAPTLRWSSSAALVYGALGVLAAGVGGWWPARAAQALPEAQTLKGLGAAPTGGGGHRVALALIVAGVALAMAPAVFGIPIGAYLSVGFLLVGGISALPWLIAQVYDRLAPAFSHRLLPLLAIERARRMRGTAAVAVSGVVASLSLAVALTVMVASFRDSVTRWLDVVLPADLYLRSASGASSGSEQAVFTPAFVQSLAQLPGVARTGTLRTRALLIDPARPAVTLIARSLDEDAARSLPLLGAALPVPAGQIGIYVSEAMVELHGARPGSTFEPLARAWGPVRGNQGDAGNSSSAARPAPVFFVAGVWRDYVRQFGAITMDARDFERLTGESGASDVALWLAPGATEASVQEAVRAQAARTLGASEPVEIASVGQIRANSLRIFDRSFAVTYWLQAVAIAIGLFGIAASFSAQVLARRKEFGLLAHLGFTRGQVLAIVAGEGAAWTAIGAVAGLLLGLAVSVVLVHVVNPQSFHWTMDLLVPWLRLGLLCAAVVVAGTLTAWLAGRAAAGHDAVMAVKEDW